MRFQSAIDFVARLTPAHLQSFWYFASKVNLAIIGTFGSVLWATSDNSEESEYYKAQLAEYRWTLRVSSKGAEFMAFTVGMLDASPVFLKDGESNPGTVKPESEANDDRDNPMEAESGKQENQGSKGHQSTQPSLPFTTTTTVRPHQCRECRLRDRTCINFRVLVPVSQAIHEHPGVASIPRKHS